MVLGKFSWMSGIWVGILISLLELGLVRFPKGLVRLLSELLQLVLYLRVFRSSWGWSVVSINLLASMLLRHLMSPPRLLVLIGLLFSERFWSSKMPLANAPAILNRPVGIDPASDVGFDLQASSRSWDPFIFFLSLLLRRDLLGDGDERGWVRVSLLPLRMMTGPVQVSPRSGRVVVLRVGERAGVPGAGVCRVRFEEGVQGVGRGGGTVACWSSSLTEGPGLEGVGSGAWTGERVAGQGPQKPASPVPTAPTHAEMVARLHELHDSEKVSKKVEEAKGRLEVARAKVMEAEEGMAKVDGELNKNGRRGDGGRRRLAVVIWKTLLLLRRRAARRKLEFGWRLGRGGRLPGKGGVSLGVEGAREVQDWMLRR